MKKIVVLVFLSCFCYAKPIILNAICTHSFELNQTFERFDKSNESFSLVLSVDTEKKKAHTVGFINGDLIMLRANEESVTMILPDLFGIEIYQWSIKSKTIFVSKSYEWYTSNKSIPIVLTIVCKVQ